MRWEARGAAIASGSVMPRSIRLISTCSTVVMIVAPPGEPSARKGLRPSLSTIVGDIELRGRLFGPGRFGSGALPCVGVKLKSVISLLSRKPRPGTTIALPPVCSMVRVYSTTLPQRSATVRFVVLWPSSTGPPTATGVHPEALMSPGGTGLTSACAGSIWQARCPAHASLISLFRTGWGVYAPTYRLRSANESAVASAYWCRAWIVGTRERSVRSRMLSASPTAVPPLDGVDMP
nr:hypothetical protein GCM10020092_027370 [Actinoplanes digitatis]